MRVLIDELGSGWRVTEVQLAGSPSGPTVERTGEDTWLLCRLHDGYRDNAVIVEADVIALNGTTFVAAWTVNWKLVAALPAQFTPAQDLSPAAADEDIDPFQNAWKAVQPLLPLSKEARVELYYELKTQHLATTTGGSHETK